MTKYMELHTPCYHALSVCVIDFYHDGSLGVSSISMLTTVCYKNAGLMLKVFGY